jgi:hypothetical protein
MGGEEKGIEEWVWQGFATVGCSKEKEEVKSRERAFRRARFALVVV